MSIVVSEVSVCFEIDDSNSFNVSVSADQDEPMLLSSDTPIEVTDALGFGQILENIKHAAKQFIIQVESDSE